MPQSPNLIVSATPLALSRDPPSLDTWIDQLSICLKLLSSDDTGGCQLPDKSACNADEFKFLQEIMHLPDQRIPFRDSAPSRHRVLQDPNGPFSRSHLRTRHGFFSILVLRALLHSTDFLFLKGNRILFESYDDFNGVIQEVAREKNWDIHSTRFCKPDAYGRHSGVSVSIGNAKAYWDASGKDCNTSWLIEGKDISFRKLVGLLAGNEFPGIGKLQALQIATDYARAGIIQPTEDEFLEGIRYVNMGAVAGLMDLGLLERKFKMKQVNGRLARAKDKSQVNREDLKSAFVAVKVAVEEKWDSTNYPWDMFELEHWLCKASPRRLGRESYYQIYE
ncbi:hypothetical protein GYMLUDRAFT_63924 [Collybiopsis luxurians FD-317 M1]|uniref:Uncharacterized protein n=1 Tax=Collybiopsis luxurians FD-317 M1 TaxID=944289 RepID=A0A0D0C5G8_9AGAR|nr:hypothetical protein GYMLUDRAFT_63924 [Collybiopsis luxurians FD-317 M1]